MTNDQRVRDLTARLIATEDELEVELARLRKECDHPRVVECDYLPQRILSHLPPLRLCEVCGVEAEGWGCGYGFLGDAPHRIVTKVTRDELYQRRQHGPRDLRDYRGQPVAR